MTQERLEQLVEDIRTQVSADEYPQVHDAICYFDDEREENEEEADAVSLADMFMSADEAEAMPQPVANFVKEVYEEEIAAGSADAACNLGAAYYSGRIGEQNFTKAVELYTIASKRGSRQATENLGYCYYYGRNIPVDYEKAFHCFAMGAFDGHLTSLYKIGDMYRNGYYVEKNEKEAFYIYYRCVQELDEGTSAICGADIYMRLADCYADGIGTEPNYASALKLYQAAENLFRDRIMNGDFYLRNNYNKCIRRQDELREKLEKELPTWAGF